MVRVEIASVSRETASVSPLSERYLVEIEDPIPQQIIQFNKILLFQKSCQHHESFRYRTPTSYFRTRKIYHQIEELNIYNKDSFEKCTRTLNSYSSIKRSNRAIEISEKVDHIAQDTLTTMQLRAQKNDKKKPSPIY